MAQSEDYRKMKAFEDELLEQRRARVRSWFASQKTGNPQDVEAAARDVLELTTLIDAVRATLKDERQVDVGGMVG